MAVVPTSADILIEVGTGVDVCVIRVKIVENIGGRMDAIRSLAQRLGLRARGLSCVGSWT